MANKNNSEESGAIRPFSYTVEKVHLFTNLNSDDQFVDLTFVAQDIIITEGISQMGVDLQVRRVLFRSWRFLNNGKWKSSCINFS